MPMCPRAPALQREATAKRRLYITTKGSSPHPLQLEEPYAQQQRLSTAKNKLKKKKSGIPIQWLHFQPSFPGSGAEVSKLFL